MIALTDSQWIDVAPVVIGFVVVVIVVNLALVAAALWCAFVPPRAERTRRASFFDQDAL